MKAIGILEVASNVASIVALDAMAKASDVSLVTTEKALGGRLVSIIVQGSVSDVKEAIAYGKSATSRIGKVAAVAIINNPHEEVQKILLHSAKKLRV
ncbi:MAG: BMC domain-containing protein [Cellulosilyticaceae bacterium]